jgi:hypothetical protein
MKCKVGWCYNKAKRYVTLSFSEFLVNRKNCWLCDRCYNNYKRYVISGKYNVCG